MIKGAAKRLLHLAEVVARILNKEADYCVINKKFWPACDTENKNVLLYKTALEKVDRNSRDTISGQLRFYSLIQMARHVLSKNIKGDFVECGVWKGHSACIVATLIKEYCGSRPFHIFDSFEGLSAYGPQDGRRFSQPIEEPAPYACDEDTVRKNLDEFDFLHFYKGWIPSRFDEVADRKFAFAHIDVDLYQPTIDSLGFFFPRLNDGGVIVVDDYGTHFEGCGKAVREFLDKRDIEMFYEIPTGGAFIIK